MSSVSKLINEDHINEWVAEVGVDVSNAVKGKAANRGTWIHHYCEQYLLGNLKNLEEVPIVLQQQIRMLVPVLCEITPYAAELPVWSKYLKVAGKTDVVGMYKGRRSIIDFKQANNEKYEEDIHHYFAQESAYAVAVEERTDGVIKPSQLVTVMVIRGMNQPKIFVEQRDDHIQTFIDARKIHEQRYTPPSEEVFVQCPE